MLVGATREIGRELVAWEFVPALEYMAAEVAAVLALASDLLVALEARGEGWESGVSSRAGI